MPIFISYKKEDEAPYTALCSLLDLSKIPRYDVETMTVGKLLAQQLKNAIQNCEACIFITTKRSLKSRWCMAELGAFWGAGKPVVIYVTDPDVSESDLPEQFKGYLWTRNSNRVLSTAMEYLNGDVRSEISEVIELEGTFVDLYLGSPKEIVDMPKERLWTYELEDIKIKKYPTKLSLESTAVITFPDNTKQVYNCKGSGAYEEGVAYITYSFKEKNTGSLNWKGTMILNYSKRAIFGYWITTHIDDSSNTFPIGTITLKRKSKKAKLNS